MVIVHSYVSHYQRVSCSIAKAEAFLLKALTVSSSVVVFH